MTREQSVDDLDPTDLVDAHVHLQRDEAHGQELWEYFLGRTPQVGYASTPPSLGTSEEYLAVMDEYGIRHANILMFTWSGRYLRDGMRLLTDDASARAQGLAELTGRIADRVRANNRWAGELCRREPRLSWFCGIDPVVMDRDALLADLDRSRAEGAVGVKVVFYDLRISPTDPRLQPVYEWCASTGLPLLSEGGHTPSSWGSPADFEPALRAYPGLRLVFAHLGHSERFGCGSDAEVARLARTYGRVWTDVSMRLEEVAAGSVTPEAFVAQVRSIGSDRVMFGSNYPISEALDSHGTVEVDGPQTVRLRTALDVLAELPLTESELADLRGRTFRSLIGSLECGIEISPN